MIRIRSYVQALKLKGQIPALAVLRLKQLEHGGGYSPDTHGYLIVIEEGDDIERDVPEAGEHGLLTFLDDDNIAPFEYVSYSIENGQKIFEAVMAIDSDKTIAFIIPESVPIDERLRVLLEDESKLNM